MANANEMMMDVEEILAGATKAPEVQSGTGMSMARRQYLSSHAEKFVVISTNGKTGYIQFNHSKMNTQAPELAVKEQDKAVTCQTNTMRTIAACIAKFLKSGSKDNCQLYVPTADAIRLYGIVGRINRGENMILSKTEEEIINKNEDAGEYMKAIQFIHKALVAAKTAGLYITFNSLDDMFFTQLSTGADQWKLSKSVVQFKDGKGVTANGVAVEAAYHINGTRTLSVRPIAGNIHKKELVALKDRSKSVSIAELQAAYYMLRDKMPSNNVLLNYFKENAEAEEQAQA